MKTDAQASDQMFRVFEKMYRRACSKLLIVNCGACRKCRTLHDLLWQLVLFHEEIGPRTCGWIGLRSGVVNRMRTAYREVRAYGDERVHQLGQDLMKIGRKGCRG